MRVHRCMFVYVWVWVHVCVCLHVEASRQEWMRYLKCCQFVSFNTGSPHVLELTEETKMPGRWPTRVLFFHAPSVGLQIGTTTPGLCLGLWILLWPTDEYQHWSTHPHLRTNVLWKPGHFHYIRSLEGPQGARAISCLISTTKFKHSPWRLQEQTPRRFISSQVRFCY